MNVLKGTLKHHSVALDRRIHGKATSKTLSSSRARLKPRAEYKSMEFLTVPQLSYMSDLGSFRDSEYSSQNTSISGSPEELSRKSSATVYDDSFTYLSSATYDREIIHRHRRRYSHLLKGKRLSQSHGSLVSQCC